MKADIRQDRKSVLVLGIGNILLRDEGFGPYLVKSLEKDYPGDDVEFLDGGTAGADLLDCICNRQKLIVIDCVDVEAVPGTLFKMTVEDLQNNNFRSLSLHEIGLAETLVMAKQLKCEPLCTSIIAVKPKDISPGVGITKELLSILPEAKKLVIDEI